MHGSGLNAAVTVKPLLFSVYCIVLGEACLFQTPVDIETWQSVCFYFIKYNRSQVLSCQTPRCPLTLWMATAPRRSCWCLGWSWCSSPYTACSWQPSRTTRNPSGPCGWWVWRPSRPWLGAPPWEPTSPTHVAFHFKDQSRVITSSFDLSLRVYMWNKDNKFPVLKGCYHLLGGSHRWAR